MTEVILAVEKHELISLPEIVIPETVRSQFGEGIKKIIPLFMSWDEVGECWIDVDSKPNLVITLARAGSLSWVPIKAITDLYEITIPRIVDVHLGRELAYRFARERQIDFRLFQSGDQETMLDFESWLELEFSQNPDLRLQLSELVACFAGVGDSEEKVVVLDDVVQDGLTMGVVVPTILKIILNSKVVFESSNEKIRDQLKPSEESIIASQSTRVLLENILEDTEWLYEIIDASFSNYLDSLFQQKKIVTRQFLVQLAKGSIEDMQTGTLAPIESEAQIRNVGQNIQQQYFVNNPPRHESLFIDPGNPAVEAIKVFGVHALLAIQVKVRTELERLGQTAEL